MSDDLAPARGVCAAVLLSLAMVVFLAATAAQVTATIEDTSDDD